MQKHVGLYAIIDLIADQIVGHIMLFHAPGVAARMLSDVYSDPTSVIAKHPSDFALYRLGFLNDQNEIVPNKDLIMSASALVQNNLKIEG